MNYLEFLEESPSWENYNANKLLGDEVDERNKNNAAAKASSEEMVALKSWTETYKPWETYLEKNPTVIGANVTKLFTKGGVKQIQINGTEKLNKTNYVIKNGAFIKELKELFKSSKKPPEFKFANGVINFIFPE